MRYREPVWPERGTEKGLAVLLALCLLHSVASFHILCIYFGGRIAFFFPLPPSSFFSPVFFYLPKGEKKSFPKFEG